MVLLDAFSAFLSGNFFWFVEIVLNNLHWFFALFAVVFIENSELGLENFWRNFVFLVGLLWAFSDLAVMTGMAIFSSGIFLIFQLVLLIFWPSELSRKHPSLQLTVIVAVFILASMLVTFGLL